MNTNKVIRQYESSIKMAKWNLFWLRFTRFFTIKKSEYLDAKISGQKELLQALRKHKPI